MPCKQCNVDFQKNLQDWVWSFLMLAIGRWWWALELCWGAAAQLERSSDGAQLESASTACSMRLTWAQFKGAQLRRSAHWTSDDKSSTGEPAACLPEHCSVSKSLSWAHLEEPGWEALAEKAQWKTLICEPQLTVKAQQKMKVTVEESNQGNTQSAPCAVAESQAD